MKQLLTLLSVILLSGCGLKSAPEDDGNLLSRFKSTWNIHESIVRNDDGTLLYNAVPWGGLVASFKERNMPVDWSAYESITFEFKEATTIPTQIMISEKLKTWGKAGITSLTCHFDGQDVTSVGEVTLQAGEEGSVTVTRVYLSPKEGSWHSTPIWKGNCVFDNWTGGFVVASKNFETANEGDKLEFVFTTDTSNPDVTYWLIKTIYSGTDSTLQGNDYELNSYGCANMGKEATVYRIVLTSRDIINLRDKGLFVNGYYTVVTQCNLLHRVYGDEYEL